MTLLLAAWLILAPTQGIDTALLSGNATWYDAPSEYDAAAGPALRVGDWRGSWVRVVSGDAEVLVRLTDWCACGDRDGRDTLLDLDDEAFARLAPLSAGVIEVEVHLGLAPDIEPPQTDTAP